MDPVAPVRFFSFPDIADHPEPASCASPNSLLGPHWHYCFVICKRALPTTACRPWSAPFGSLARASRGGAVLRALADFQGMAESCGLQTAQVYPNDGVRAATAGGSTARTSGRTPGGSRVDIHKKARSRLVRRLATISRLQALPPDQLTDEETLQIAPNKRGEITRRLREIWGYDEKEKRRLHDPELYASTSSDYSREAMSKEMAEIERLGAVLVENLTSAQQKTRSPERRQTVLRRLQELWADNNDIIPAHCWGSRHGSDAEVGLDAELVVSKILDYVAAREGEGPGTVTVGAL